MNYLQSAIAVLDIEARAIVQLKKRLNDNFIQAVNAILSGSGRVVMCGMGKSGHIARKIFATLVSTGTPSVFVHPGEAYHGDLGLIQKGDIFVAISYSGETEEIIRLIPYIKENHNFLIAITGQPNSTLGLHANVVLNASVDEEACPYQLAPTASTTAALAIGDALAIVLMKARDFTPENFARFHPGGSLGQKLLGTVAEQIKPVNFVSASTNVRVVISALTASNVGLVFVGNENCLQGIITDGDLRRAMEFHADSAFFSLVACDIMSNNPITVDKDTRLVDADNLMKTRRVNSLVVASCSTILGAYVTINK